MVRVGGGWCWTGPRVSVLTVRMEVWVQGVCRSPQHLSRPVQCAPPACWPCSFSACSSNGQPAVRPEGSDGQCIGTRRCWNSHGELLPCVLILIRPLLPHAHVSVWLLNVARDCFLGRLLYGGSQLLVWRSWLGVRGWARRWLDAVAGSVLVQACPFADLLTCHVGPTQFRAHLGAVSTSSAGMAGPRRRDFMPLVLCLSSAPGIALSLEQGSEVFTAWTYRMPSTVLSCSFSFDLRGRIWYMIQLKRAEIIC